MHIIEIRVVREQLVFARYGIYQKPFKARTVADLRRQVKEWGVPSGAVGHVSGRPVDDSYLLRPDDTVEFSRY